jgi:F0F1-type ATP synthase assembly protein I
MNTTMTKAKAKAKADYEVPLGNQHHETQQAEETPQEISMFLIAGIVIGIALMIFAFIQFAIRAPIV